MSKLLNHTPGEWDIWDGPEYSGGGRDLCIGAGETWLFNMDHRNCEARDHHMFHCTLEDRALIADTGQCCELCLSDENLKKGPPYPECQHADLITDEQHANAVLITLARQAPHDCPHADCPGPKNKRKLEAFDALVPAMQDLIDATALALRVLVKHELVEEFVQQAEADGIPPAIGKRVHALIAKMEGQS